MADILIRKVSDAAKEKLSKAAAQAGASLEAFLRQRLEQIARETPQPNDEGQPFGSWAVSLFADIDEKEREEFLRNLEEIENLPAPQPLVFEDE